MKHETPKRTAAGRRPTTRREFLHTGSLAATAMMAGLAPAQSPGDRPAQPVIAGKPPNFLFIISDQLGLDAISAHGCPDVHTPHIDRLVRRGVTFLESHSTNPVCSPARSSLFTGRMPVETGVISNNRPIHPSRPNLGQWLHGQGYDSYYCGKWHLPQGYPVAIDGFEVLPVGGGQGDLVDGIVSRWTEAFLKSRQGPRPFLYVASLMNPHDICYWAIQGKALVPKTLPFDRLEGKLPQLPPNHTSQPAAPAKLAKTIYKRFSDQQWRYYIHVYYRQVEMVDAEIGRILDALDDSGLADQTVVIFTADHGEGRGRHLHVSKWYPYDEAAKVPMVVSSPGRMAEGLVDRSHLVCGLDVMSTICDYARLRPPADVVGRSLRPLLEQKPVEWREFVASEHQIIGRMLRTQAYKYVHYRDDPVEQLFDMVGDPWETKNLYRDPALADVLADHRKLLAEWQASLKPIAPTPDVTRRRKKSRPS